MYIPFDKIDFDSRIWIYQTDRLLTSDEAGTLNELLKSVVDGWETHGKPLTASAKIFHHRFVVIAVDESKQLPSGCSIDKSVNWLKEIGIEMNIDFFDRSIAWLDDAEVVHTIPLPQVKQAIKERIIKGNTIVFDNLVQTKAQWMKRWKIPASNSWMKRYLDELSVENNDY
jgi:hypothetical protein